MEGNADDKNFKNYEEACPEMARIFWKKLRPSIEIDEAEINEMISLLKGRIRAVLSRIGRMTKNIATYPCQIRENEDEDRVILELLSPKKYKFSICPDKYKGMDCKEKIGFIVNNLPIFHKMRPRKKNLEIA